MKLAKFAIDLIVSEQQTYNFTIPDRRTHVNALAFANGVEIPFMSNPEGKIYMDQRYRKILNPDATPTDKIRDSVKNFIANL